MALVMNYSRQEAERQLTADKLLWSRFPVAVGSILWPLTIATMGWNPGWWIGMAMVALIAMLAVVLPPRTRVNLYLIDLLEWVIGGPLEICWLLLLWHLATRESIFPLLGQPLLGSFLVTILLLMSNRIMVSVTRFLTCRLFVGGRP